MPTPRQTRRPPVGSPAATGKGVDSRGGPVIDPTENVLALVDAESKYQNGMREAEARHAKDMREASDKYQDAMREAEARRMDDLDAQKVRYENRMSDVLTVQVKTTSDLISAQLDKTTTSLGNLITTATTSMNERIAPLEQFRYETGGKTSVQDPALANGFAQMATAIASINSRLERSEGVGIGQDRTTATQTISTTQSMMMVGAIVAVLTFGLNYFTQRPAPPVPQIVYLPPGAAPPSGPPPQVSVVPVVPVPVPSH